MKLFRLAICFGQFSRHARGILGFIFSDADEAENRSAYAKDKRNHSYKDYFHMGTLPRIVALGLLVASLVSATPYPHVRYLDVGAPYTLIAGHRTFFYFKPLYAGDFTCVAATDICTITGGTYTPHNGDLGTTDSTVTLPGGLYTKIQIFWPLYAVCNASGATFQFKQNDCSGMLVDITSVGTGTHTLNLYHGNGAANIYLDAAPTGFPAGSTFEWRTAGGAAACNTAAPTSSGKPYSIGGGDSNDGYMCMIITVPSNATPGTGTGSMVWCQTDASVNCHTFTWDYNVVSVSFTPTTPSSFSAIPGLSTWVSTMTATNGMGVSDNGAGPSDYVTPLSAPTQDFTSCPEFTICLYDGAIAFYNIAQYLSNSAYNNGGTYISNFMKAYYVSNGGNIPQFKVQYEGLSRATQVTGDPSYRNAANLLQNSAYVQFGARPYIGFDREMAYALSTDVDLFKYAAITNTYWADMRDTVYGFLLRYTETSSANRADSQGFYMGLMMKALIQDYQVSHDDRIAYVIKRSLDRLQATYNVGTHTMMYALGVDGGPWCASNFLWFVSDPYFNCQVNTGQKLNNLVAPAFAWYYAATADTTYRDNGDDWFGHALDAGLFTGKESGQIYYWSFQYPYWRSGAGSINQWYGDTIAPPSTNSTSITGQVTISGRATIQ